MGAILQPSSAFLPPVAPGRCRYCRCTDARACPEGCWWVDQEHTICSSEPCVQRFEAKRAEHNANRGAKVMVIR